MMKSSFWLAAAFFVCLACLQDVNFSVGLSTPTTSTDTVWQCPPVVIASDTVSVAALSMIPTIAPTNKKKLSEKRLKYIERFAHVAVGEMEKYGIPASITLAQGCLDSADGTSYLARTGNNHFGVKCRVGAGNKCRNYREKNGKLAMFMQYETAWESYRHHSQVLEQQRYKFLHGKKDYRIWAKGLQTAHYASDKEYARKLIDLIERYSLHRYDKN